MGRKYKTTRLSVFNAKKNEKPHEKRREALRILHKSRVVDVESKMLYVMLVIIITMFTLSPFFIMIIKKRKHEPSTISTISNISNVQNTYSIPMNSVNPQIHDSTINDAVNIFKDNHI